MSKRMIISRYPKIVREWLDVFEKNLSVARNLEMGEYIKVI